MNRTFPAFCHISEYGEKSLKHFPRLVALSAPLVVWGPSSIELNAYGGEFSPQHFLELVDDRAIQVVAREPWLTEPRWRNQQGWAGAAWTSGFDDVLLDWLKMDEGLGTAARVRVMPAEQGRSVAEHHFRRTGVCIPNEDLYNRVLTLYHEGKVPLGTRQKADRSSERISHRNAGYERLCKNRAIASEIVRDAFNHTDAVADSASALPFWEPGDGEFIALVDGANRAPATERPLDPHEWSELRDYLLRASELLERLEKVEPTKALRIDDPVSLRKFLRSEQRQQLVEWMKLHADKARDPAVNLERVDRYLVNELRRDLDAPLDEKDAAYMLLMPQRKSAQVLTAAQLLTGLVSAVEGFGALLTVVSVSLIAAQIGERVVFPHDAKYGTRWPFLYAFGDEQPTDEKLGQLRAILDELVGWSAIQRRYVR